MVEKTERSIARRSLTAFGMTSGFKRGGSKKREATLSPLFFYSFPTHVHCHSERSEEPRRARQSQSVSYFTVRFSKKLLTKQQSYQQNYIVKLRFSGIGLLWGLDITYLIITLFDFVKFLGFYFDF